MLIELHAGVGVGAARLSPRSTKVTVVAPSPCLRASSRRCSNIKASQVRLMDGGRAAEVDPFWRGSVAAQAMVS